MEIFGNFPEKYEIFRTNFQPHITNCLSVLLYGCVVLNSVDSQHFHLLFCASGGLKD